MPEAETSLTEKLGPIISFVSRRRWYILSGMVITSLATVAVLYQLPNRYTSEATLFVVEQQVPQRYVTPTNTTELADALPAMTQEVLSRSRLLELVEQFDLYASQRHHLAPEEIDALMRQYISIDPLPPSPGHRESNAFKISFTASTAILAQEVTSKLTSLFIQENVKTREDQARTTTNFLSEHMETAKQKLAEQEAVLKDFKTKYLGELPEQQQGNLAILSGAQLQLQNISASLDRAQQQRVYLESLIEQYRRLSALAGGAVQGATGGATARRLSPYQTAQADLAKLQEDRARLLVIDRPAHPDVIAKDREIAVMHKRVESLEPQGRGGDATESAPNKTGEGPQASSMTSKETVEESSIAQLKSQLESNRVEVENLLKDETKQKATISQYQSRLNLTPVREQELAGILRDYELSKLDYSDLLGKKQQSQLAMSLEKEQAGQQFRLVEPPSLPALPSSPKRLKMSLGGVGAGLFLGLLAAGFSEMRRAAFYTEKQLTQHFSIPLVVALPLLVSNKGKWRRAALMVFEWFGGTIVVSAVLLAEFWVYKHP